MKFVVVCNQN